MAMPTEEMNQHLHRITGNLEEALGGLMRLKEENPNVTKYDLAFAVSRNVHGKGADEDTVANFAHYLSNLIA